MQIKASSIDLSARKEFVESRDRRAVETMFSNFFQKLAYDGPADVLDGLNFTLSCSEIIKEVLQDNDGNTIAFIAYYPNQEKNQLFIKHLVVAENSQRKGCGTSLLMQAIVFAGLKDFQKVMLFVNKDNRAARNLYEKKFSFKIDKDHSNCLCLALTVSAKN